jgi:hypothetical protein
MAKYPNDDTREILAFAVPANVASALRRICEQEFFTISHICRTALFRDLKARGIDFNDDNTTTREGLSP